jgi:hypothetical protein
LQFLTVESVNVFNMTKPVVDQAVALLAKGIAPKSTIKVDVKGEDFVFA